MALSVSDRQKEQTVYVATAQVTLLAAILLIIILL